MTLCFAQEHKQNMRKNVICNFIELINYVTSYKLQHDFEIYTQRQSMRRENMMVLIPIWSTKLQNNYLLYFIKKKKKSPLQTECTNQLMTPMCTVNEISIRWRFFIKAKTVSLELVERHSFGLRLKMWTYNPYKWRASLSLKHTCLCLFPVS